MVKKKNIPGREAQRRTVLESEELAGVIYNEKSGYLIFIPPGGGDDDLPEAAVALVAAGIRLNQDEGFRGEMVAWLEALSKDSEHS